MSGINSWGSWASNLNTATNLVNTIKQEAENLNNANNTPQQVAEDLNQINQALSQAESSLSGNPGFEAFESEVQTTMALMANSIIDPATGQLIPIQRNSNGTISFSFTMTMAQFLGGQMCPWMPSPNTKDAETGQTWNQVANEWKTYGIGPTTFYYTLPNGAPITLTLSMVHGNMVVSTSDGAQLNSYLQVPPGANAGQPLINFLQNW